MEIRKLSFATSILALSFFVSGCEEPAQILEVSSRPVKTIVVGGEVLVNRRTFPAVVDAIQKADISFRVSGKIQAITVKEGDQVKQSQILAELDPTDFKIILKDQQASYDTAKANFDRAVVLVEKGAISRVDHDNLRARYQTAVAALEAAKQKLRHTRLKANFDGFIAKRHVESFEEVTVAQTVFSLQDVSALKIKIDVPENIMIGIKKNHDADIGFYAVFGAISAQKFPLSFLETTAQADPHTKTFQVTLKMDNPENYNVLPGMTATVIVELFVDELQADGTVTVTVPVSAVVANNEKQATVWIVDEKTMTVNPKTVKPGLLMNNAMQVTGLNPGARVVVAGAAFLRNDMKVTLLETGEQAK